MANACKKDKHLHKTLFKKNCYDSEDSCGEYMTTSMVENKFRCLM